MTDNGLTGLPAIDPLAADIRKAAASLGRDEARFLVDTYYQMQHQRISLKNQGRALSKSEEPHGTINFFGYQFETLEEQIRKALDTYSDADKLGQWARSQIGIGPVIAAGLLAHIDIEKAPTVGHIWRFAGLDPTVVWGKGEKRPWNADLKVLCWKIGDSFVKQSGHEKCFYGHKYKERKEYELERDAKVREVVGVPITHYEEQGLGLNGTFVLNGEITSCWLVGGKNGKWFYGGNAQASAETLVKKNIRDAATKAMYESGHLPAGRLDARARRWAVKLFLAHYHEVGYKLVYNEDPPLPYPIAQLGHTHKIEVPS